MAVNLSPVGGVAAQFFTNNAVPLSGGKLYTYAAGTTTPQVAYTTSQGNIAWTNPIVLDAGGRVPGSGEVWLTDGLIYKFVLKDANDVLIATYDNISGISDVTLPIDSSQVTYDPPFTASVPTTVESKLAESKSVKDYGAVGDGVTSDYAAFNLAIAEGGTIYVPPGTYNLDGQILVTQDNTTIFLASDVTLLISNVPAVQTPSFGAHFLITGQSCSIIGSGPGSLIQAHNGTYSNAICFSLDYGSGTVQNLTLDGDKNNTTAQADDSFGAAIMTRGYANRTAGGIVVDNCIIRNWNQYGFDIYNNVGRTTITNCVIHDNGVASQAYSVGVGIIISAGCNDVIISNNIIFNNKRDGISSTSGAWDGNDYAISNNSIFNNGDNGITFLQQANYGSVTGYSLNFISVTGNNLNGNTGNGIVFSTSAGSLKFITCTGNTCVDNGIWGISAASTDALNRIENITISGNVTYGNANGGIQVTDYVLNWSTSGNVNNGIPQETSSTFTPVLIGTTSAGTATYSTQQGSYTKINNMVFYQIALDWSGHTGTGDMRITGLPYAASSTAVQSYAFAAANSITVTGQVAIQPIGYNTYANVYSINNGTTAPLAMDAAGALLVAGSYATNV